MSTIHLALYVAGRDVRIRTTVRLYEEACTKKTNGHSYSIRVIDILKQADIAETEKILATPTLIREKPFPEKRIIGEVNSIDKAIAALDFLTQDL